MNRDTDWVIAMLLFLAGGLASLYQTWRIKKGYRKWEFLRRPNLFLAKDAQYGMLPFGVSLLISALGALIAYIENSERGSGFGRIIVLVGIFNAAILYHVFMFWKPNWLKPKWLLWLEAHYNGSTIEFMFEQARQDRQWRSRTETDEGLMAWAEEMAEKYEQLKRDPNIVW